MVIIQIERWKRTTTRGRGRSSPLSISSSSSVIGPYATATASSQQRPSSWPCSRLATPPKPQTHPSPLSSGFLFPYPVLQERRPHQPHLHLRDPLPFPPPPPSLTDSSLHALPTATSPKCKKVSGNAQTSQEGLPGFIDRPRDGSVAWAFDGGTGTRRLN
jgi:hypothetical protein